MSIIDVVCNFGEQKVFQQKVSNCEALAKAKAVCSSKHEIVELNCGELTQAKAACSSKPGIVVANCGTTAQVRAVCSSKSRTAVANCGALTQDKAFCSSNPKHCGGDRRQRSQASHCSQTCVVVGVPVFTYLPGKCSTRR